MSPDQQVVKAVPVHVAGTTDGPATIVIGVCTEDRDPSCLTTLPKFREVDRRRPGPICLSEDDIAVARIRSGVV